MQYRNPGVSILGGVTTRRSHTSTPSSVEAWFGTGELTSKELKRGLTPLHQLDLNLEEQLRPYRRENRRPDPRFPRSLLHLISAAEYSLEKCARELRILELRGETGVEDHTRSVEIRFASRPYSPRELTNRSPDTERAQCEGQGGDG
jgi:hypothetical protein